jgi:DNA-binding CsgD family transcriptional regulator
MKVRGLTLLTRKVIVTKTFGAEAWLQLYRDVARSHSSFGSLITQDTLVPLRDYLAFHDELVRRFYKQDTASHLALGRESARWALGDGPFKVFLDNKDLKGFVAAFPKFWPAYFADTTSRSEARLNGDSVEFKTINLPEMHPYFEHFVMGYMAEALEMFCANPIGATRLRAGGNGYHYLLHTSSAALELSPDHAGLFKKQRSAPEKTPRLSDREMDVLLLIAEGKTNDEIGIVLGISGKTVQHHVANAYRKIDVSGRVGAAMWLAQRGLVGN